MTVLRWSREFVVSKDPYAAAAASLEITAVLGSR